MMDFHVLTTHTGADDKSPLQLISAERLAYYWSVEAAYLWLLEQLAAEIGPPAPSAVCYLSGQNQTSSESQ